MHGGPADVLNLFLHMGVFGLVTLLIYLACMAMVRVEDRRQEARRRRS